MAGAGAAGVTLAVPASGPETFGAVPEFTLTDQEGQSFSLGDLRGKPFAAAAIFTTCAGPCPQITASMVRMQAELADSDVRLVSISVDPEFDTPPVLNAYAAQWSADTERWSFLTGEKSIVYDLIHQGFWLAAQEDPEAPRGFHVTHKTSLVAVDREGVRRGWYDGTDPEAVELLIARLRFLAEEH